MKKGRTIMPSVRLNGIRRGWGIIVTDVTKAYPAITGNSSHRRHDRCFMAQR